MRYAYLCAAALWVSLCAGCGRCDAPATPDAFGTPVELRYAERFAMERDDAKTIPIIALSANARDEDKRMSMQSGMNHHIAKPFDVASLISTVNEHIAPPQKS